MIIMIRPAVLTRGCTSDLPPKIIPTKIASPSLSGKLPLDKRIPPLEIKIMLESSPPKSRISVRRLAAPLDLKGVPRKI